MINMIINSFKFNNAYNKNAFIYRLRQLPIIGKKIPKDLYNDYLLDILINLVFGIYSIIKPFIGKFIYLLLFIGLPMSYFSNPDTFLNIFVFLTIIGAFCNTDIFNPSKSKYYSVVLMRMNTKKYVLSSLTSFLLKVGISFYPSLILFGIYYEVNLFILLLLPIFVVSMKLIGNFCLLKYYEKTYKVINENNFALVGSVSIICIILAYLLPYLGYSINNLIFIIIFIISLVLGILSLRYIFKCNNYNKIYKKMLNLNNVIFNASDTNNKKKQYSSKIENTNITSKKEGYEYFNDLFIKRHSKILTKSAIKYAIVIIIIFIVAIVGSIVDENIYKSIHEIPLNSLPYFVFIMYFLNRGSIITGAMFINCDHSMLAYRFYRKPKVILSLFKTRLKTLIKINMIPTIVIAIGLPLVLFITGGTTNYFDYLLLFISIIFLSIFFSVHHLVLYYLLQPYDINMKAKSSTYSIVNGITYFICYMFIDMRIPTTVFAIGITLFAILYILISLLLIYKYAPITFKLKQ